MAAVNWPDFSRYGMRLIMRQTAVGRTFFQMAGASRHPEYADALRALDFTENRAGGWVRLSMDGLNPARIAEYFPEAPVVPTARAVIAPDIPSLHDRPAEPTARRADSERPGTPAPNPDARESTDAPAQTDADAAPETHAEAETAEPAAETAATPASETEPSVDTGAQATPEDGTEHTETEAAAETQVDPESEAESSLETETPPEAAPAAPEADAEPAAETHTAEPTRDTATDDAAPDTTDAEGAQAAAVDTTPGDDAPPEQGGYDEAPTPAAATDTTATEDPTTEDQDEPAQARDTELLGSDESPVGVPVADGESAGDSPGSGDGDRDGTDPGDHDASEEDESVAVGRDLSGTPELGEPAGGGRPGDRDGAIPDQRVATGRLNYQYDQRPAAEQPTTLLARRRETIDRQNAALSTLIHTPLTDDDGAPADIDPETLDRLAGFDGWNVLANQRTHPPLSTLASLEGGQDWCDNHLSYIERMRLGISTLTSFYTPDPVIRSIWDGIRHMGFEGGRILEPSCGSGRFIGLAGDDGTAYRFLGVDIDPVATAIARRLYPQSAFHTKRFQDFTAPDNSYDLIVSNVPFDSTTVSDPRYARQHSNLTLHDYFFLRSMDLVRPGGIVALVTSYGTLDKPDPSIREAVAESGQLLGAWRLPMGTFSGTDAGADLIVLQKYTPEMTPEANPAWVATQDQTLPPRHNPEGAADPEVHPVNQYFVDHPDHILGTLVHVRTQFGSTARAIPDTQDDSDIPALLGTLSERLREQLPADSYVPARATPVTDEPTLADARAAMVAIHDNRSQQLPVGSHVLDDNGELCVLEPADDRFGEGRPATPVQASATKVNRLKGLVRVRDAALALLDVQQQDCNDDTLATHQNALADAYAAFTGRYGPISRNANSSAVLDEPYSSLLLSLENYDEESDTAERTPIFTERTIGRPETIEQTETYEDALAVSLNQFGRPVPSAMAELMGNDTTVDQVIAGLGNQIFLDPETQQYQTRSQYLSGNIATKLDLARTAAETDPRYARNIPALEDVMPAPLSPGDISIGMGSSWIPERIYAQYLAHAMGCRFDEDDVDAVVPIQVDYDRATGTFHYAELRGFNSRTDYAKRQNLSTDRVKYKRIIDAALNNRTIELTTRDDDGHSQPDTYATAEANSLIRKVRDDFEQWAKASAPRAAFLADRYNEIVNVWVEKTYDGSHLTFPGLAATVSFRSHQADFAWRVIQDGNALAAHVVGAGKTGAMIAAAMESKRLGRARKPMFSVPKQVLMDFASAVNKFYPSANVLVIQNSDLTPANRPRFLAQVASHNWDAILITHDAFGRIPMSLDYQQDYLAEQLRLARNGLDGASNRGAERELNRRIQSLENRLGKLAEASRDDNALNFERLGVDMLIVDEAHKFKNLAVATTMADVPGVSTSESKRATDLHMKSQYIMEQWGAERGVVFATGTPISNSMVEMYNMSRYLAPSTLEDMNMENFDAWINQFGRVQTNLERSPDGSGYRMHARLSKFVNVPELVKLFRQVADVKMHRNLNLPIPHREVHEHAIEPSAMLTAYMRSLAFRAKNTKSLDGRENDNILAISSDGRHASLDLRTLSPDMPAVHSKIGEVVDTVVASYHDETPHRGVQVIFCDLSTPKKDRWSFYDAAREALTDAGIPADQIAFIHDAKSDSAKSALYAKVRAGQIRVLLGSTDKLGTGTNIQDRISDMHHIDPPWRSVDFEQRQGRGIRQGNQYDTVREHFYVTRDSYDEFMLQAVRRKADFIAQALTDPDRAQRTIEEQADPTYAEIMALSTGNPLIKEKVDLDAQVEKLAMDERFHHDRAYRARTGVQERESMINRLSPQLAGLDHDIVERQPEPESFVFHMAEPYDEDGHTEVTDRSWLGHYIDQIANTIDYRRREEVELGTYAGVTYRLCSFVGIEGGPNINLQRDGEQPTSKPLSGNAEGIASQITHLYRDMPTVRANIARRLEQAQTEKAELEANDLGAFPQAEELAQARQRLQEVETTLAADAAESEDSYPPELMAPLVRMMHMRDRRSRPLVPREMVSHSEREAYEQDLMLEGALPDIGTDTVYDSETGTFVVPESEPPTENDTPQTGHLPGLAPDADAASAPRTGNAPGL